jgi:hypothetical protein
MSASVIDVQKQIELLDKPSRIQILHWLWELLDPEESEALRQAELRAIEMAAGSTNGVGWPEVQKELDKVAESEQEWQERMLAEADRRDDEMRSGKVQGLSPEEFWQRVEASKRLRRSA